MANDTLDDRVTKLEKDMADHKKSAEFASTMVRKIVEALVKQFGIKLGVFLLFASSAFAGELVLFNPVPSDYTSATAKIIVDSSSSTATLKVDRVVATTVEATTLTGAGDASTLTGNAALARLTNALYTSTSLTVGGNLTCTPVGSGASLTALPSAQLAGNIALARMTNAYNQCTYIKAGTCTNGQVVAHDAVLSAVTAVMFTPTVAVVGNEVTAYPSVMNTTNFVMGGGAGSTTNYYYVVFGTK